MDESTRLGDTEPTRTQDTGDGKEEVGITQNVHGGEGERVRRDLREDRQPQADETRNTAGGVLAQAGSGDSITDPASYIARNWYRGMKLEYSGVDFGKCMEYDVLQVVNRTVVKQKNEREQ